MCAEEIVHTISSGTALPLLCEDYGAACTQVISCGRCRLMVCPECWAVHKAHQEADVI